MIMIMIYILDNDDSNCESNCENDWCSGYYMMIGDIITNTDTNNY